MVKDWCHTCHACHAKVEVDVTKYHACHVKRRWMSPSATPAMPTAAASRRSTPAQARHRSQPSAIRATPATRSEDPCHQVPNAIRATPATQKWKSMSPSTTPATWNEGECLQVPRLPRQQPRRPGVPLRPKRATGASPVPYVPRLPRKSGSRCHQVPRLPRQQPRRPGVPLRTKCATGVSPVPYVPRLPRKVRIHVTKCHACHAKWRSMSPSDTRATQSERRCQVVCGQSEGGCHQVPRLPHKVKVDVTKCHAYRAKTHVCE